MSSAIRPSNEQKLAIVEYFEKNDEATVDFGEARDEMWNNLATTLNALGGSTKDGMKWRKFWKDLKMYTKYKYEGICKSKHVKHDQFKTVKFAEVEKRILQLIDPQLLKNEQSNEVRRVEELKTAMKQPKNDEQNPMKYEIEEVNFNFDDFNSQFEEEEDEDEQEIELQGIEENPQEIKEKLEKLQKRQQELQEKELKLREEELKLQEEEHELHKRQLHFQIDKQNTKQEILGKIRNKRCRNRNSGFRQSEDHLLKSILYMEKQKIEILKQSKIELQKQSTILKTMSDDIKEIKHNLSL